MTFDARDSALGYSFQVRRALQLLLETSRDEAELAIETLDDVSFESEGTPEELLQLKHRLRTEAVLTNASPDIWKTIRIWGTHLCDGKLSPDTRLTLITTAAVGNNKGSIPYRLTQLARIDNEAIAADLLDVAHRSQNEELQPSFLVYRELSDLQRLQLVTSMLIICRTPDIVSTAEVIKRLLQVRPDRRDALFERIEGWWFDLVIRHLMLRTPNTIKKLDLIFKLDELRDQLKPDSLPIDYARHEPPEGVDAHRDQRQFVEQLRHIAAKEGQIRNAILDYYRAFQQRSRWEREGLLNTGELEHYETRLADELKRHRLHSEYDQNSELELQAAGRQLFKWAEESDIRIRSTVQEPYVMRGSFHILANEQTPKVWWHPQFVERLRQFVELPEATTEWEKKPLEVRNLFNPAFCAKVLHIVVSEYSKTSYGMPYPLAFLVLPTVLHRETREALPKGTRTRFHVWSGSHKDLQVGFAERTRSLVSITKDAIQFGMEKGYLALSDQGHLTTTSRRFRTPSKSDQDETREIAEIKERSRLVGRWYAQAGSVASIYVAWGVRP